MTKQPPEAGDSSGFLGFEKARRIMWCYEARARVHRRFLETSFLTEDSVAAVHVDNTTRADRVFLTAYDADGALLSGDILYVDDPRQPMDVVPEFDHDYTNLKVAQDSDLGAAVDREFGWVVNMRALRSYDNEIDRQLTQRAVVLSHLPDMLHRGDATGFIVGALGEADEPESA